MPALDEIFHAYMAQELITWLAGKLGYCAVSGECCFTHRFFEKPWKMYGEV
jgi:hypothetical protein